MLFPRRIGPYEVLDCLGQGGMGMVFRVRDPRLGRPLALKLIKQGRASATALERFLREAELLARVQHPGVIRVHQLGRAAEGPYLVSELIDGLDLSQHLEERGRFDPQAAASLVQQIAQAVHAVHAQGVLHRDLKPANVMLRADSGLPVLLDFGLARDVDAETLTKTGQLLGTPAYMAPEQARGDKTSLLTPAVDVHGLGVILYELLTGQLPYDADGQFMLLKKVIALEPDRWPRQLVPEVPEALDAVVRQAMSKAPGERYPSAEALADDLGRFLAGAETSSLGELRRRRRRRFLLWLTAAVVATSLLAAGAWAIATSAPPAAPSVARRARPGEATPRGPRPLWTLETGATLPVVWRYSETDETVTLSLEVDMDLKLAVGEDPEHASVLVRLGRTRGGFGGVGSAGTSGFDSDAPDPEHPLSILELAPGSDLRFTLDRTTGQVEDMTGIAEIFAAMDRRGFTDSPLVPAIIIRSFFEKAFTGDLVEQTYAALLHVRGEGSPLPWLRAERPTLPEGSSYFLEGEPLPAAVHPASLRFTLRREHRFDIQGRVDYGPEGFVSGRAAQVLVGTSAGSYIRSLREGHFPSRIEWSITRR